MFFTLAIFNNSWQQIVSYPLIRGNGIWRFGLVMATFLICLIAGRIFRYWLTHLANRHDARRSGSIFAMTCRCFDKPVNILFFAIAIYFCKLFLYFSDTDGIKLVIRTHWNHAANIAFSISVAYALYRLVDIVEYFLEYLTSKTATKLDDMLVPVVRKSLRFTISMISGLYVAQCIFGSENIKVILASAGIGGIALALAAKDTIANFFGSITIFADRPFQVDDLITIDGKTGSIKEVGFRSTKLRTLQGHLVTIPNSTIANSILENIGDRPFIRRTTNLTITYDSGVSKTELALRLVKEILAGVEEINTDSNYPPRVYFSAFNDCSLNLYMSYWVKPADYWVYQRVNELVNLSILRRFEASGIDFAFPTQTLHIDKNNK